MIEEDNMQSGQIKRFAVFILGMITVMLFWAVFWPTNLSLPDQPIFLFNSPDTLFMFFLSNFIILALIHIPKLGFFTNSKDVTVDDSFHEGFGELAYCQQHIVSCDEIAEQETPNSQYRQPTEHMKLICSAEDAGANARYSLGKSKKMGCRNIIKYRGNCQVENCSVSQPELMQLVEVPDVMDIKKYNELASMIDEDFNRTVEEFIDKFKRQLRLQRQQSVSRRGLRL